jgi:hypothetical protein
MEGVLSRPVLVLLAWAIAGLLWWDRRRRIIGPNQMMLALTALALIVVAMALALAAVPASPLDQLVCVVLLVECAYGFVTLARRHRSPSSDER